MNAIPDWFHNTILDGLQRLYSLGLQGSPAAETLEGTAMVWIEALWAANVAWDHHQDGIRLRTAFQSLVLTAERWPTPGQLLKAMPPRPEPLALPEPKRTYRPEIGAMLRDLKARFKVG